MKYLWRMYGVSPRQGWDNPETTPRQARDNLFVYWWYVPLFKRWRCIALLFEIP